MCSERTLLTSQAMTVCVCSQIRAAAAQARVQLCEPTLASLLSATNVAAPPPLAPHPGGSVGVSEEKLTEPKSTISNDSGATKTAEGPSWHLAQAAALSAAAQRLYTLHSAQRSLQDAGGGAGRKRTAADAGLELGEDGEPPPTAAAALSPMLSMHAVPALRHEAFKVLNAASGQEPTLLRLVDAATSDVTASGLVTRALLPH
jgi:hypothetical protein